MTEQSKALRLADALDKFHNPWDKEAAAELRRLHDVEKAYESACKIISEQDKKLAELETVNAELLEALKNLEKEFRKIYPVYYYAEPWGHETNVPLQAARAVIAKAEEQK